jgi:hypothetical protein
VLVTIVLFDRLTPLDAVGPAIAPQAIADALHGRH